MPESPHLDDNVIPLERIRRYRVAMNRRRFASQMNSVAKFTIEASTVLAVLGRGLRLMARELGHEEPRKIRWPD